MNDPHETEPVSAAIGPLVTVGITCFNARDTITRAVRSVRTQTWQNLEILIVDDGSTDGSVDLVRSLACEDPRIRLVCHERNLGTACARTTIVHEARGEFLAFLDDDDEAMPDRISAQVEAIEKYEIDHGAGLIACYTSRLTIQPDGNEKYVTAIGTQEPCPHSDMVILYLLCGESAPGYSFGEMGSGTLMARMLVFRKVGDFDERFRRFAEWDWAVRLALLGGHFIGNKQALIRQHVTQSNYKAARKPLEYALLLRRKHRDYLQQKGVYLYSILAAYSRFYYARGKRLQFRLMILLSFLLRPATVWRQWRTARRNTRVVASTS